MDADDARILEKMGQIIARKRKVAGFTQEEVAEHLGIGNEAFSRIERGLVSPGIPKLYALADMFECGIDSFFVESSKRPTDHAIYLTRLLERLDDGSQDFVIEMIEKLIDKLEELSPRLIDNPDPKPIPIPPRRRR